MPATVCTTTAPPAARAALAALRTAELAAALDVLGVVEHHWLDYPDARAASAVAARRRSTGSHRLLADVQPTTVLSFGPDGFTGHPDHRAVARWTELAVARTRPRPQLLQAVTTASRLDAGRDVERCLRRLRLGLSADRRRGRPGPAARLDGNELDRKVAALRAQHSQTAALSTPIGVDRFARWVRVESFRRA